MFFSFSPLSDVSLNGYYSSFMFNVRGVNVASVVNVVPQNERTRILFLKTYARSISVPDCKSDQSIHCLYEEYDNFGYPSNMQR